MVRSKVKTRSSGWSQEVEEIRNIIAQQQGTEGHTEGQELTLPIQRGTQDKGQKVKCHIRELHVLGEPGHREAFEPYRRVDAKERIINGHQLGIDIDRVDRVH